MGPTCCDAAGLASHLGVGALGDSPPAAAAAWAACHLGLSCRTTSCVRSGLGGGPILSGAGASPLRVRSIF
eukprot:2354297-Amphidinium_carterae.1